MSRFMKNRAQRLIREMVGPETCITDTRHAPSPCPTCGKMLDASTGAHMEEPIQPEVGDITICGYCSTLLAFGPEMTLRRATQAEFEELDPQLQKLVIGFPPLGSGR